jgi:hypothetical protein
MTQYPRTYSSTLVVLILAVPTAFGADESGPLATRSGDQGDTIRQVG